MNRSPEEENSPSTDSSPQEDKQSPPASISQQQPLPNVPFLFAAHHPSKPEAEVTSPIPKRKPTRKRKWRKPKDMPKRPLSAYNIFFHDERKNLASEKSSDNIEGASMGFAGLAQTIATRWRALPSSSRAYYEAEAAKEQLRYRWEVDEWTRKKKQKMGEELERESTAPLSISSGLVAPYPTITSQERPHDEVYPHAGSLLALWPSTPQTLDNLGNVYNAQPDARAYGTATSGSSRQFEVARRETEVGAEPARGNASMSTNTNTASVANAATTSSLHQLASELDDDEMDFLSSLR